MKNNTHYRLLQLGGLFLIGLSDAVQDLHHLLVLLLPGGEPHLELGHIGVGGGQLLFQSECRFTSRGERSRARQN